MKTKPKYKRKEPEMTLEDLQAIRDDATGIQWQQAQDTIDNFFLKDKPRKSKREQRKLKKKRKTFRRSLY